MREEHAEIALLCKDKLPGPPSIINKEVQGLVGIFRFGRQYIPYLGVLHFTAGVTSEAARFDWIPEKRRLCYRSRLMYKLLCLGSHNATDPTLFKGQWQTEILLEAFGRFFRCKPQSRHLVLEQALSSSVDNYASFEKQLLT